MEDKIILSVFNYPELYNITLSGYRCTESRSRAWRTISDQLGLSSVECKRRWKNMRDRYLKEVRMEIKSKEQGEVFQSKWKYRQLMNFIAPYVGSKSTVDGVCTNSPADHSSGGLDVMSSSADRVKTPRCVTKAAVTISDIKSEGMVAAAPDDTHLIALAKVALSPQITATGNTERKRRREQMSSSQSAPLASKCQAEDSSASYPCRSQDEDELFLLSFVPALKRLSPQKRCETKMKIQQMMYEAEFNITESDKPKTLSETSN